MTFIFLDKYETATTGDTIFVVISLLFCFIIIAFLSYRFKIVLLTDKSIKIITPFRFQLKDIKFSDLTNLNWDLWGTYRTGDYRRLTITTSSGFQANISDFEFINYDSLEKWVLERTSLDINFNKKLNVELQQAKWNKWTNLFIIGVLIFFFILLSNEHSDNIMNISIRIAMIFITWRLIVKLIQYQKRIDGNKKKRKLRK